MRKTIVTGDLVPTRGICQLGPCVQVNHCGSRGFSGACEAAPAQLCRSTRLLGQGMLQESIAVGISVFASPTQF